MKEHYVSYGNNTDVVEIWKDVVGYEGLYQVSNLGRVRSLDKSIEIQTKRNGKTLKPFRAFYKGKILKPTIDPHGYALVQLRNNGDAWFVRVHRLVAMAFLPNPDHKPCINHLDNTRNNNVVTNLEWCTYQENSQYAAKQGRIKGLLGKHHTEETKERIRKAKSGVKQSEEWVAKRVAGNRKAVRTEQWRKRIGDANRLHGKKIIDTRTMIEYPTVRNCAQEIGISESTAYRVLKSNGYLKYAI